MPIKQQKLVDDEENNFTKNFLDIVFSLTPPKIIKINNIAHHVPRLSLMIILIGCITGKQGNGL